MDVSERCFHLAWWLLLPLFALSCCASSFCHRARPLSCYRPRYRQYDDDNNNNNNNNNNDNDNDNEQAVRAD